MDHAANRDRNLDFHLHGFQHDNRRARADFSAVIDQPTRHRAGDRGEDIPGVMCGRLPHAAIVRCSIAGHPRRPERGDQTGRQADLHAAAIPFNPGTMQPGIGVIETCRHPIRLELFGVKPLEQHLLNPPRVDVEPVFRCEIRVCEHRPVEGYDRGHTVDAQFGERPPRPL